ncbi:c-type cytochrome [Aquilutibacter rugosus]|uniref:c-type cytochrome n=1 Tax=Aquilutibacter rugosus TaxID=3115820 RepID=UPI002F40BABE
MSPIRILGLSGIGALAIAAAVSFAQNNPEGTAAAKPAAAAATTTAAAETATWGDPAAGATKAAACAACHGLDGNPTDPQYPRLAGMPERYVAHQIELFKKGLRTDGRAAEMLQYANALTAQDARDIGAHFAKQKAGALVADATLISTGPNAGKRLYEVGQDLYWRGDAKREIAGCFGCHGSDGRGNAGPSFPHIGGQNANYVKQRLAYYRAGVTQDPNKHLYAMMNDITKSLSDEEIAGLAAYVSGLHDRSLDTDVALTPAQIEAAKAQQAALDKQAPAAAPAATAAAAPAAEAATK